MNMDERLQQYQDELDQKEINEHVEAVLAVNSILQTEEGRKLFLYLYKSFGVGEINPDGLEGAALHEYLGFLKSGNSIFKLASEAHPEIAASLLSTLERKRYDEEKRKLTIINSYE